MVGRRDVDHRAHERWRLGKRLVDDQAIDQPLDGLEQRTLLAILDDQPPRRGAALPRGQIGRLDDDRRGRLQVLGVPHHQRIVAAQLEREDFVRRFGELPVQRPPGARRTGEQQAIDARLRSQRATFVRPADQQADDTLGDTRSMEAIDQEGACRRGLFGWLEDHRIASDQRRNDVPVGKVRGEVIGAEHRQHAMRLVADRNLVADRGLEPSLRGPLGISVE